MGVFGSKC